MRIVTLLLESPRLYELETVDVADVPTIELLDGETYKPSETLSSGQRTIAFVAMLLLDPRGPLVIDQPEDNLANPYLAQHLCGLLAEAQQATQLVFVTHNGNIPILGRVQRVFEFKGDGTRGWVAATGAPKAVAEPMENNFEGGREAFVARKDFYGA
jgi:ABC-type lipoprotein export system ATPase subunit